MSYYFVSKKTNESTFKVQHTAKFWKLVADHTSPQKPSVLKRKRLYGPGNQTSVNTAEIWTQLTWSFTNFKPTSTTMHSFRRRFDFKATIDFSNTAWKQLLNHWEEKKEKKKKRRFDPNSKLRWYSVFDMALWCINKTCSKRIYIEKFLLTHEDIN